MTNEEMRAVIANMSPAERSVIDAIRAANNMDEKGVVDNIIQSVQERRARFFDIIYVDLAIDRSTTPLEISGAGTGLIGLEATDNNSNLEVSFELQENNTNERMQFRRGKRFFAPYSKFYVYHTAQSGKYLKLLRVFSTKSISMGFQDDSGEAANSDLVVALGNSSIIATAQVSVGATSTLIKAANTSRKRITIMNLDAGSDLFIGVTGVTITTGHAIPPKGSITLNTTAAIYGVFAVASNVSYLEE